MMKKIVLLGNGGYSRTLKDIAEQLGYLILAVLDDKDSEHPLFSYTSYIDEETVFMPAFGNNEFRLSWCDRITQAGGQLTTLIHPTAYVSTKTVINPGTAILPHATINTDVVIGRGCIINLSAIIDHGCIIEEGCHICLGAIVKSENRIPRLTKIDAGDVVERSRYSL